MDSRMIDLVIIPRDELRAALIEINRLCETGKITGKTIDVLQTIDARLAQQEQKRPRVLIRPTSAEIKTLWNATRKPREFAEALLSEMEEKNQ